MGLENKTSIGVIEEVFPKAQACICKISLPVIHLSFEGFHKAFMTALELGGGYSLLNWLLWLNAIFRKGLFFQC